MDYCREYLDAKKTEVVESGVGRFFGLWSLHIPYLKSNIVDLAIQVQTQGFSYEKTSLLCFKLKGLGVDMREG